MKGVAKMGGGGLALLEELGEKLQHPPRYNKETLDNFPRDPLSQSSHLVRQGVGVARWLFLGLSIQLFMDQQGKSPMFRALILSRFSA